MILTIFRPKRVKNGKPNIARSYRGRYRLDGDDKLTDIPLHTTDKRVARERLEQIVREKQLESVGILPAHRIRAALQEPAGNPAALSCRWTSKSSLSHGSLYRFTPWRTRRTRVG
jgi:hypothetical protein